jgi:hypothetical protein
MRLAIFVTGILLPASVRSGQKPVQGRAGFGLFDYPRFSVNRVDCGLDADGRVCQDDPVSTLNGGLWPGPRGALYMFASGPAVAGRIGPDGGPWAGDTAGGFFYDRRGVRQHAMALTRILDATEPADLAAWPEAARAPGAPTYRPSMAGAVSVSSGDSWWLSWEGDPRLLTDRPHPSASSPSSACSAGTTRSPAAPAG